MLLMGEPVTSLVSSIWRYRMNISSVNYRPTPALVAPRQNEASEAPGPDHDGDADDIGAAAAPAKAAVAAGVGQRLDMLA